MKIFPKTSCGNCPYDCCCKCMSSKCYECRYCRYTTDRDQKRYSDCDHRKHYVCFDCKIGWKTSIDSRSEHTQSEHAQRCPSCSKCGAEGAMISSIVELPKQNDHEKWELLKKMHDIDVFKGCPVDTLGHIWYIFNGITWITHMPDTYREMIWYPHSLTEYVEWVTFMKTTKMKTMSETLRTTYDEQRLLHSKEKMIV